MALTDLGRVRFIYEDFTASQLEELRGEAGDSAYDVAVEEGFVGTKAQWLASLKASASVSKSGNVITVNANGGSGSSSVTYIPTDSNVYYNSVEPIGDNLKLGMSWIQ